MPGGKALILAACGFLWAPAGYAEKLPSAVAKSQRILAKCGADEAALGKQPSSNWADKGNNAGLHAEIRQALAETLPDASYRIWVSAAGGHLATAQISAALTRDANGQWRGNSISRNRIWVEGSPWTTSPRRDWVLPAQSGRRLDAILDDRCFYAEPASFAAPAGPPPLGAMIVRLDVKTPSHKRGAEFMSYTSAGLTRELLDVATPK